MWVALAEWSKALELREKITENQKDPRFASPRPVQPFKDNQQEVNWQNRLAYWFAKLKNLPNGPKPRKNLSSRYKCFLGPPQKSNNIKVRSFKKWPRLEL